MSDDKKIISELNTSFDQVDVAKFREILTKNPVLLRNQNGTDRWMWYAARKGHLSLIKVLVDLGVGVNESKGNPDPDNPFYQVEGAILSAASAGQLEVVKWLLNHGAQINFEVKGQVRCLPLLDAAANGHLDVVKILVEHGALIESSFNGHTPLSQANDYGQTAVYEYLSKELEKQKSSGAGDRTK